MPGWSSSPAPPPSARSCPGSGTSSSSSSRTSSASPAPGTRWAATTCRRARSLWWRSRPWRSPPPTAGGGSPAATRSGTSCPTAWSSTSPSAASTGNRRRSRRDVRCRNRQAGVVSDSPRMPALDAATAWLNSAPLGPAELRGHVVLVDFWTFTCINWLRTEPYVRAWSQAYRDDGLVVIGVHTPEFSFEHDVDRVRRAVRERGIDHPVVVDDGYRIWRAFDNHYWPALYLVDRDGRIRDQHFGEGRYAQSERTIQRLLGVERDLVQVASTGVEAEADWANLRSPETYLGYARGENFASP